MKSDLKKLFLEFYEKEDLKKFEHHLLKYRIKTNYIPNNFENVLLTYPNSFENLQGLSKVVKNKKIKELFDTIHILPMFLSNSDGGFAASSYTKIDTQFGEWSSIHTIKKNYRIMIDGIFNHTSNEHPWFKKFLDNKKNYKNYYITYNSHFDYSLVVRPRTTPLFSSYTNKKVLTTFSEKQIDLNVGEVHVFFEFLKLFHIYSKKGISTLRLDAIAYIIKKSHSTCANLEETYNYTQLLIKSAKEINPNLTIVCEANFPDKENVSYVTKSKTDLIYQFSFPLLLIYSIHNQNFSYFLSWFKNLQEPKKSIFFLSNHDGFAFSGIKNLLQKSDLEKFLKTIKKNSININYRSNNLEKIPYEINTTLFSFMKQLDPNYYLEKYYLLFNILSMMEGKKLLYYLDLIGEENDVKTFTKTKENRDLHRKKYSLTSFQRKLDSSEIFKKIFNILNNMKKINLDTVKTKIAFENDLLIITKIGKKKTTLNISNISNKEVQIPKTRITLKPYEFVLLNEINS